jgi:hypothetical protein
MWYNQTQPLNVALPDPEEHRYHGIGTQSRRDSIERHFGPYSMSEFPVTLPSTLAIVSNNKFSNQHWHCKAAQITNDKTQR